MGIRQRVIDGQEGVRVTEILSVNKDTAVTKTKSLVFKMDEIEEYKKNFLELVKENIITGSYEGRTWSGMGNRFNRCFDFAPFEYNNRIYQTLKAYSVTLLYHERIGLDVTVSRLNNIKEIINITKNFNVEYIEELDEYLDGYSPNTVSQMLDGVLYYLLFNPMDDSKEFLEVLASRSEFDIDTNPRTLPPVTSVIAFSDVLETYMCNEILSNKVKYYPIYLWWRITSVIPMRPCEFLRTKRDCLTIKDGRYYLQIVRAKRKPNPLSKKSVVPFCDTFEINKEMFDLISDYINIADIHEEEYLLPLSVYAKNRKYQGLIEFRSTFKDRFNHNHLSKLLNEFYEEVVSAKYKVENSVDDTMQENQSIVKMKLGDTRHFAFCSLMLQGFNPIAIASLGGHVNLESQMNYHQHLDTYVECHTYLLKQAVKQNIHVVGFNGNVKTSRELALMRYNENEPVREVDGGWCCSTDFPNQCTSIRCIRCSKFKLDFKCISDETKKEIENASKEIEQEIKNKIGFVKKYYSASLEELKSNENNAELKRDAAALEKVVREKARIIAMQEKITEV